MIRVFPRIVADSTVSCRLVTSATYPRPVYQVLAGALPPELVLGMSRWPGPVAWYDSQCFPVMPLFEAAPGLSLYAKGIEANVAMKATIDNEQPRPGSPRAEQGRRIRRWFDVRARRLVADWRLSQYAPEHRWAFLYGRLVRQFGPDAMTYLPQSAQRAYYHAVVVTPGDEPLQQRWESLVAAASDRLPVLAVVG